MIDWRNKDIQNHLWQLIKKPYNTGPYVQVGDTFDRVRVPKAKPLMRLFGGEMHRRLEYKFIASGIMIICDKAK